MIFFSILDNYSAAVLLLGAAENYDGD